jgi:hypothetical protein
MIGVENREDTIARPGDWIEVHMVGGGLPRRGQVVEVLGAAGHERYRVRWDEEHESIHYPRGGGSTAERILRVRARG